MPISLHSITFSAGEKRDISDLFDSADNSNLISLKKNGLNFYRRADKSTLELAAAAMMQTLANSGLPVSEIDCVVYASGTFEKYFGNESWQSFELINICRDAGLKDVPVFGVSYNDSCNFVYAVQTAVGLIESRRLRNVIVLTSDIVHDEDNRLLLTPGPFTVYSDTASSCIVSGGLSREFELIGIETFVDYELPTLEGDLIPYALRLRERLKELMDRTFRKNDLKLGCQTFLPMNINMSTINLIVQSCDLNLSDFYCDSLPEFGHAYSSDFLINLAGYAEGIMSGKRSRKTSNETVIGLIGTLHTWSTLLLKPVI